MSLSAIEHRALAALDEDGLLACLEELLSIPSVTGSPGESLAQQWFAERLRESGLTVDLWEIPLETIRADPEFPGSEAERTQALGLSGSWGADRGPTLILNGHIDVVPPGDANQWQSGTPFRGERRGEAVYGRGACDMKGGLVCNLFALRAIQAAGLQLTGRVLLQSVVGEEDGGLGTFAALRRGQRADAAIITEPTNLQIIPACAGALTFRLVVEGRSAHASVRTDGVSAIEKFLPVFQALHALEARRNGSRDPLMRRFDLPYPLSIGTLRAGDWPSSVPETLVAEGRLGVALGERPEEARLELERTVAEVAAGDPWLRSHPVRVEWFGGQFASGGIAPDHSLVGLVGGTHRDLAGSLPEVHGAPYGSDLRLLAGLGGIPAVHYGPGDVRHAHAPDEHVPVAHLRAVARTLILSILRFCGAEA